METEFYRINESTGSVDIFGSNNPRYPDPSDAEFKAAQYSIAQNKPEAFETNVELVQSGEEGMLRDEIARGRNSEYSTLKRKMFSGALEEGDAELAYQTLQTPDIQEPAGVALERSVVEHGFATQIAEENYISSANLTPEEASNAERMLIFSNYLMDVAAGMGQYMSTAEGVNPDQAFEELGAAFNAFLAPEHTTLTGAPSAVVGKATDAIELAAKVRKAASVFGKEFYMDLLASFVNTPTAGAKSNLGEGKGEAFLAPGEEMKDFLTAAMKLPNEELRPFLEQNKAYLMEVAASNPLRAFSIAWDSLYNYNWINPTEAQEQFAIWKTLPEITIPVKNSDGSEKLDSDGKPLYAKIPNPLYEMYAQGGDSAVDKFLHAVDVTFASPGVQDVVDTPVLDALALMAAPAKALKMINRLRTLTRVVGRPTVAASTLAKGYTGSKNTAEVFVHAQTVLSPVTYADPMLAAEMRRLSDSVGGLLREVTTATRVTPDPAVIQEARNSLINNKSIIPDHYMYSVADADEGNTYLGIRYGAGNGSGFASEQAARAWADSRGFQGYTIENPTGSDFLVNFRVALEDAASVDTAIEPSKIYDYVRTLMGIGKYGFTPNVSTSAKSAEGATAANIRIGKYADVFNNLYREMGSLSKEEGKTLNAILRKGQRAPAKNDPTLQGRWYSEYELDAEYLREFGRKANYKEKKAYYTVKTAFDLSYALENKRMYDTAASAGVSAWKTPMGDTHVLGKEVPLDEAAKSPRFLASIPGGRYTTSAQDAKMAVGQDGIAIKVFGDLTENGRTVTYIFAKKGEFTNVGLPRTLLNYTEGGSRQYVSPWFLKGRNSERTFTLGNFTTAKEAEAYKAKYNKMLGHYNKFLEEMGLASAGRGMNPFKENLIRNKWDGILQTLDPRFTTKFLDSKVADGVFDPKAEVHVLYDRQSFPGESVKKLLKSGDESAMTQSKGRLYYSQRGETLFENGDSARWAALENPLVVLERQQNHAVRMAGFSDYALGLMHSWVAKYGNFLDDESRRLTNPEAVFKEGNFPRNPRAGINHRQQWLADAERAHIQRVLQQPDTFSQALYHGRIEAQAWLARNLEDNRFMQSKYLESLRTGRILDGNIIDTFKGLAYDLHLGLFNVTHLWLQALGSQAAVFMHPVHGVKAIPEALVMWGLTHFPEQAWTKKVISYLDANAAKAGVYAKGEFAETMELYRLSGMHNIRSSDSNLQVLARVDTARTGSIWNSMAYGYDKTRSAGRIFVYEGERIARLVTFNIARRMAKEKIDAGVFKYGSGEHIQYMIGKANDLQLGMMSGMEAAWSKNSITTLGMQMLQYPIKATEVFLGLNRQLTTKEKIGFALGSMLTYGSYGVPFGPQAWTAYRDHKEKTGDPMTEEQYKLGLLGGFDAIIRNLMDTDTAIGSKLGYGDFHASFILGNKGFTDFLGGIFYKAVQKFAENFPVAGSIVYNGLASREIHNSSLSDITALTMEEFGDVLSGASMYRKAYVLDKYGMLLTSKGNSIVELNSDYSALALALGIPPAEEVRSYIGMHNTSSRPDEMRQAAAKIGEKMIQVVLAQRDNNPQKAALLWTVIGSMREAYDFDPIEWDEVLRQANMSLYDRKTYRALKEIQMYKVEE